MAWAMDWRAHTSETSHHRCRDCCRRQGQGSCSRVHPLECSTLQRRCRRSNQRCCSRRCQCTRCRHHQQRARSRTDWLQCTSTARHQHCSQRTASCLSTRCTRCQWDQLQASHLLGHLLSLSTTTSHCWTDSTAWSPQSQRRCRHSEPQQVMTARSHQW